eukprot:m.7494 g.7494  ORF g.7494 m.7494 type:complete len:1006 (-) comp3723_c0_seq2:57-3074(-)
MLVDLFSFIVHQSKLKVKNKMAPLNVLFALFLPLVSADLGTKLSQLQFNNYGKVTSMYNQQPNSVPCIYLEPENISQPEFSWASKQNCPYMFDASHGQQVSDGCGLQGPVQQGYDRRGFDLAEVLLANVTQCLAECCSKEKCVGFVFATAAPVNSKNPNFNCKQGQPCCYLKYKLAPPTKETIPGLSNGVVQNGPSPPQTGTPPVGMRSSVPLGGIGAGSFELRGDGTLHQFTIFNNFPAGAPKFWAFPNAIFGLHHSTEGSTAIQTHPPQGIPGVSSLLYSGAYPVSKLTIDDTDSIPVQASMYAYSRYVANDMKTSAIPATAFSLVVENLLPIAADVGFSFIVPFNVEPESSRPAAMGDDTVSVTAASPEACLAQCNSNNMCSSWSFVDASESCTLNTGSSVPFNQYTRGSHSGIKGVWSVTENGCLTLTRPGNDKTQGTLSVCAESANGTTVTPVTGTNVTDVWGKIGSRSGAMVATDAYGALAIETKNMEPYEIRTLTIVLSWHFPERYYMQERVGNFYTTMFNNSEDAAQSMLPLLEDTVDNIAALHSVFTDATSVPIWLTDTLINMLSHIRSAWWEENGKWRQWEAYDCVNVDSIHNDGERHIPYITIFPESTKSKLLAWGKTQLNNGMLTEQLACGCTSKIDPNLDVGCGRIMSDVSSMYIVYILELYRWQNDTETLKEMYPIIKRAAMWHMNVSAADGTPEYLVNTYDILRPEDHKHVTYNSVFHLLCMSAAAELARAMDDDEFAHTCDNAVIRARSAIDEQQWVENGTYSHYSFAAETNTSLMVDSFYGQLLANSVGLGLLVANATRLKQHLIAEQLLNDSPFGLLVKSDAGVDAGWGVWQGGSPNWASLNIAGHDNESFTSIDDALAQPLKSLGLWRSSLNDLWNICGISKNGLPYITSHYGYAMTAWHIPYALSGQNANLPQGTLTFNPKVPTNDTWALPFYMPGVLGTINYTLSTNKHILNLKIGNLTLRQLAVGNSVYPGDVNLQAGESVMW